MPDDARPVLARFGPEPDRAGAAAKQTPRFGIGHNRASCRDDHGPTGCEEAAQHLSLNRAVVALAMDLEDRGRADFSHRFLNSYLEITGDYAGLVVLPFYLAYRALVRAKVARLRAGQPGVGAREFNG